MAVCQFFLRGHCRYGSACRNEHPQGQGSGNRSGSGNNNNNLTWQGGNGKAGLLFNSDSILKDLTADMDKPMWPLSSYGPARNEPVLIPNLDESPEELRVKAFTAIQSGTPDAYLRYESEKISAAEQMFANARNNVNQAFEQAARQSKSVVASEPTIKAPSAFTGNNFGSTAASTPSSFGPPSVMGGGAFGNNSTSVFGGGAINTTTSVFGNPTGATSVFGSTAPTSTFGKPAFGQSAFGQSAAPATSAFSQPQQQQSVFGQASQPQSSIIKPATGAFGSTTGGSAFGNPSPFGAAGAAPGSGTGGGFSTFASQPSAFGVSSTATNIGASAPAPAPAPAFGQSVFGQTTAPAFGQPSTLAQGSAAPAFGATSAFGALAPRQPGPFSAFASNGTGTGAGTGTVFGSSAPPTSAFAGASSAPAPVSAFSSVQPPAQTQPTSVFASITPDKPTLISAFGQQPIPVNSAFNSVSQPSSNQSNPSKTQESPPNFSITKSTYKPGLDKYDALLPDNYAQVIPDVVREAFKSEKFTWGNIPEWIPPKELR